MLLHQRMFVTSMAVAAGLSVAAAGYAQTASPAPPAAAAAAKATAQTPPPAAGPMARLDLTQAQRDQIRTLREAQRKDAQALRERMRTARQQLQQAMRTDIPDEAAVRSAAAAVAALQADQAVLQARSRAQFMKMLTPEQQARMKQARARAAERARRADRQMMRRQRMMRQQYPRWWRGWI